MFIPCELLDTRGLPERERGHTVTIKSNTNLRENFEVLHITSLVKLIKSAEF